MAHKYDTTSSIFEKAKWLLNIRDQMTNIGNISYKDTQNVIHFRTVE